MIQEEGVYSTILKQNGRARTWFANVLWKADLSAFKSLNWRRPTSPSAEIVP